MDGWTDGRTDGWMECDGMKNNEIHLLISHATK